MKTKVHRWPVKMTGPRGKVLERTAEALETRELEARPLKAGRFEVNFGMGNWVAFQKNGDAIRKKMRDWKAEPPK